MTTVPPVPSPRPAEEIRSPVDIDHLVEQLSIQNFRPIRSELYAALSELRDHRAEVERLSAELADARGTVERVSAAWADVIQRQQRADNAHRYDAEEITGRADAAERALEAVRALHVAYDCTAAGAEGHETCGQREWCYSCGEGQPWPCTTFQAIRDALSAASPTTSDDVTDWKARAERAEADRDRWQAAADAMTQVLSTNHSLTYVPMSILDRVSEARRAALAAEPSGPEPTTSDEESE